MNIIPSTRTVTDFKITLSEADAREAVDSPCVFADRLADELRAAGVVPSANGDGKPRRKPKPESHIKIGRAAKSGKHPNGKAAHPNGKGHSLEPVECPDCGQKIARKYLSNHRAKKHGVLSEPATASAAESASTG